MISIDWASFVAGALLTWLLMAVVCAITAAIERIMDGKQDDEPQETAGQIELIDIDYATPHDFGAPMADEYAESARRKE